MKVNITFKSVLSRYKNIENRNKHFDELSDEGKRLEIAWDALQLLLSDKIKPARLAVYWSNKLRKVKGDSKKLQKTFNDENFFKGKGQCMVCERGAIMLSQIRLGNCISSDDSLRDEGFYDNLKGFSLDDMIKMEGEYEWQNWDHPHKVRTKEKMANILCNVLVNGNFNPQDNTDYIC